MGAECAETAALLVSELVTSALQHRPRRVGLLATRGPQQTLRVDVREEDPESSDSPHPWAGTQQPIVMLLARLASRWGVNLAGRGARRTVWFTLRKASPR